MPACDIVGNFPGRMTCQRLVHSRFASFMSQYQASVKIRPCAAFSPSVLTSTRVTNSPAKRCPPAIIPNSKPCLIALSVSLPAFARPMILALDCCACSRKDEKSWVLRGWRTHCQAPCHRWHDGNASTLSQRPDVQARVKELKGRTAAKMGITREYLDAT